MIDCIVNDGFGVLAARQKYQGGDPITLSEADFERLSAQGIVRKASEEAAVDADPASLVAPEAAEAERLALERFEQMAAILEGKTEDVLAAARDMEPDALAELLSLEQTAQKPRKGVIEGIEAELAKRAEGNGDD